MNAATLSPSKFRERFPVFERKVFLNSCSKGALATSVERAYGEYLESWKGSGSPWDVWVSRLEAVRNRFASLCGASGDEVAITFCASTATSSLLSALSFESVERRAQAHSRRRFRVPEPRPQLPRPGAARRGDRSGPGFGEPPSEASLRESRRRAHSARSHHSRFVPYWISPGRRGDRRDRARRRCLQPRGRLPVVGHATARREGDGL